MGGRNLHSATIGLGLATFINIVVICPIGRRLHRFLVRPVNVRGRRREARDKARLGR